MENIEVETCIINIEGMIKYYDTQLVETINK